MVMPENTLFDPNTRKSFVSLGFRISVGFRPEVNKEEKVAVRSE